MEHLSSRAVATGRNQWQMGQPRNGRSKPKPLPLVATGCRSERMVRRGSTSRFAPGRCDPFAARETASRAHPTLFAKTGNDSSRADPAGGSRKLPQVPANPRNGSAGKPCTRRKSPPIPAQAGSAMTGLSRRRSRVRVPSLPPRKVPANRHLLLSIRAQSTRSRAAIGQHSDRTTTGERGRKLPCKTPCSVGWKVTG